MKIAYLDVKASHGQGYIVLGDHWCETAETNTIGNTALIGTIKPKRN
jgi:hypothetical protein